MSTHNTITVIRNKRIGLRIGMVISQTSAHGTVCDFQVYNWTNDTGVGAYIHGSSGWETEQGAIGCFNAWVQADGAVPSELAGGV